MAQAVLDTQGPLNRRKMLIARLMGQMQGTGGATTRSMASANPASTGIGPAMRSASADVATARPQPGYVGAMPVTASAPEAPASVPAAPAPQAAPTVESGPAPWQAQGFHSQQAMSEYQTLNPVDQERILANPVARRRFFNI